MAEQILDSVRSKYGAVAQSTLSNDDAGVKAVAEWFPRKERSVGIGYFTAGTSLGAAVTLPIVTWLMLHYNWRVAFAVTGALSLIWAAAWWLLYRAPADHPALGAAEREHILAGRPAATSPARRRGAPACGWWAARPGRCASAREAVAAGRSPCPFSRAWPNVGPAGRPAKARGTRWPD